MRNSAVVAMIICGTCCVLAPWVYGAYYAHLVADSLAATASDGVAHGLQSARVTIFNESTTALKWWSVVIGLGTIIAAIAAGARQHSTAQSQ